MTSRNSVHKRTIEVHGHEISVVQNAEPQNDLPVVLIHGITLSSNFWPLVVEGHKLQNCRWISVSLPGHYPSTVPETFQQSDVTPQLFADAVAAAIDECFDGQAAHLIGWSTGGFTALATAALHPERVPASSVSVALPEVNGDTCWD